MTHLIKRRYKSELAPELTLHVFDQTHEGDDGETERERSTYIEVIDEREDGYEVETIVLNDSSIEVLHKILGEIIVARVEEADFEF